MKTMRKALLTAGLLAALPGMAAAQTISTTAGEITFSGLFTTDGPDNVPQTADDALGAPNATVNISGVGYLTGGAFFGPGSILGYPFSPVYRTGVTNDERGANYTFVFDAGPGTITDVFSGIGDNSVITEYTTGTLNIYRTTDVPGATTNNTFGTGTAANRATFADGTLFLSSSVSFLRSSFNPSVGQGSVTGNLAFTGGELFTSFLQPNNILGGVVNALSNVSSVPTGYDFVADGRIDASVVPEPSTYMLMGTGLLALAGFARRRRA
ncbi:MAG: PEP-CTERM sorting domain-containing protein [Gemmatirosa sp.]